MQKFYKILKAFILIRKGMQKQVLEKFRMKKSNSAKNHLVP